DDNEIDEDAELEAVGERMERRGRLPQMLLGQRFGVLAGAPAYTANDLPVGPKRTVEFLVAAAAVLDLDLEARELLYRAFDRQLGLGYEALVESLNELLSRERVLPGLSYVPLRRPRRAVDVRADQAGTADGDSGRQTASIPGT